MGFLVKFFSKNSLFLFFLLLQIVALVLIFSRNSMQQSWLAAQVSALNSQVSGYIDEGASYLKLKEINDDLVAQNQRLLTQLYGSQKGGKPMQGLGKDTLSGKMQTYSFVDGDVVYNSINRKDNYFTINRGKKDGVTNKMGVIAPQGIAGIVINTTKSFALVQSVLSTNKIRINAALKNSGYFGTLTWRGEDSRLMHLSDVPKYVPLKIGDTIVTDDKSAIFPAGIMIGKVAGYEVDSKTGFWDISVELSEKMGNISKVFIVKNLQKSEVQKIQDTLKKVMEQDD